MLNGIASPTLHQAWRGRMRGTVDAVFAGVCVRADTRRYCRQVILTTSLVLGLSLHIKETGGSVINLITLLLLLCVFFYYSLEIITAWRESSRLRRDAGTKRRLPDEVFLEDCLDLSRTLDSSERTGFLSLDQLKERAFDHLVKIAFETINREKIDGPGSDEHERWRKIFRRTHLLYLKFNLAKETWNVYFVEAEKKSLS